MHWQAEHSARLLVLQGYLFLNWSDLGAYNFKGLKICDGHDVEYGSRQAGMVLKL